MTNGRLDYPRRGPGLDHEWFDFRSSTDGTIQWPRGRVAVCINIPVEFFPLDSHAPPVRPAGGLDRGYPDFWSYSNRDYGLRLGIFRLMRVLQAYGVKATAQVQGNAALIYGRVIEEIQKCGWEIAAGGFDMGRPHHGLLSEEEERDLIVSTRTILSSMAASPVHGWASPGQLESNRTLDLICEQGFKYIFDWANDDAPYWIKTRSGPVVSLPSLVELSDRFCMVHHTHSVASYVAQVLQAYEHLSQEATAHGSAKMLSLSVSPWVMGYPHRIKGLDEILQHLVGSDNAWFATAGEVAQAFAKHSPYEQ